MGAFGLAIGNLLGSNLFDLLILAIDDAAYLPGPLFEAAKPGHLSTVLAAVAMNAVVLIAGVAASRRKAARRSLPWASLGLLATYALNVVFTMNAG